MCDLGFVALCCRASVYTTYIWLTDIQVSAERCDNVAGTCHVTSVSILCIVLGLSVKVSIRRFQFVLGCTMISFATADLWMLSRLQWLMRPPSLVSYCRLLSSQPQVSTSQSAVHNCSVLDNCCNCPYKEMAPRA